MSNIDKYFHLLGTKKGKLTILSFVVNWRRGNYKVLCRCECGNTKEVGLHPILRGDTVSCGCFVKEKLTKHGLSSHHLWQLYMDIISRCYKERNVSYKYYGGKGVTVCDEWRNSYETFHKWCIANGWQKGLYIDRIKNELEYSPDNCRFLTSKKSARNRTNNRLVEFKGVTKCVADWADEAGIGYYALIGRLDAGWPLERALFEKLDYKSHPKKRLNGI